MPPTPATARISYGPSRLPVGRLITIGHHFSATNLSAHLPPGWPRKLAEIYPNSETVGQPLVTTFNCLQQHQRSNSLESSLFPDHIPGLLVLTQSHETGMPQVTIRSPLDELKHAD